MIQVVLSPESQELAERKVASGRYHDISAVIEDALLALDERERLEGLRAMIAIGDEQIERGEYALFTPELMAKMERNAMEKLRAGHKPNPDVCP